MDEVIGRPCCPLRIGRLNGVSQPSLLCALELVQGGCVGHPTSSPVP